jgi:peptidyl-prolyl cis-trans isomerase SurA
MKKLPSPLMLFLFLSTVSISQHAQLLFGPVQEIPSSALDYIVAVVNNEVITRKELDEEILTIKSEFMKNKVLTTLSSRQIIETQILEQLIIDKLKAHFAALNGITVDDASLDVAVEMLAQSQNMSLVQIMQSIKRDGISFFRFRDSMRRKMISDLLRQKLVDSQLQISEQEITNLQNQMQMHKIQDNAIAGPRENNRSLDNNGKDMRRYHISQILIPLPEDPSLREVEAAQRKAGDILAKLHKGTDFAQLEESVRDLGWISTDRLPTLFANIVPRLQSGQVSKVIRSPSGFHIVKILEIKKDDTVPFKEIMVTETHIRHIMIKTPQLSDIEAKQKLDQIRQSLKNGADFSNLAIENSEDKISAERGGDLGWVRQNMLVPQFQQVIDTLKLNQVSIPFKTKFGWHIIQVLERRQLPVASPEIERARIREELLQRRSDEEWAFLLHRLRNEAYVEVYLPSMSMAAKGIEQSK